MSNFEDAGPLQSEWPDLPAGDRPKLHRKSLFRELPFLILVALVLALLVKTFLVQAFYIPSESMEPTLHGCDGCKGDRVLVNRLVYRFRAPARGEVIVFEEKRLGEDQRGLARRVADFLTEGLGVTRPATTDFIKRVIGLPDETIEYKNGVVTITKVDGKKITLDEPYIAERDERPFGPFHVPVGEYFVMGDNRLHSGDSRFGLGTIAREDIVGKAFVKVWPPRRMGRLTGAIYRGDTVAALGAVFVALARRRRLADGMLGSPGRSDAA